MTPFEKAQQIYKREFCSNTFEDDLSVHFMNGFVFSTPDFFIMGRPVIRDAAPNLVTDPVVAFEHALCDCWYIYAMAGDVRKAWGIMPWPLPWFGYQRGNELRFQDAARIQRLSLGENDTLQSLLSAQRLSV